MNVADFLDELETKDHAFRARRMVEVGREATAGNAAQAELLNTLETGRFYARWLCLQSCYGSRDGARTRRFLGDESSLLRARALRMTAHFCDDAQTQEALEALPFDRVRRLLRWLHKAKRLVPIDAYLTGLADRNDEKLSVLLPFGSPDFVARHLALITGRAGQDGWKRLARLHPDLTADLLITQAKQAERFDPRLLWQANLTLSYLADRRPQQALEVVAALQPLMALSRLNVQPLALRCPDELAQLMLQSGDTARVNFERRVERLLPERLNALLERFPDTLYNRAEWLKRLTPERRATLYETFGTGWQSAEGTLVVDVVSLLPRPQREAEARRHLVLPALTASPLRRLPYAGFLPWDEARAMAQPFLQNPDADLRGAAPRALAVCVRYYRDHLPDLLALLHARRNEQDPVRLAMLNGLSELPPGMFRIEHLDALGEIVFDTLAAADLSYRTGTFLQERLITLLPFHPAWATNKIAFVLEKTGRASMGHLETRLSDTDTRRIAPELLPVLTSWEQREREYDILAVAQSLGRRIKVFSGLAEMLERILQRTKANYLAGSALALLAEHRSDRAAALIPALLKSDGSWATQATVYLWLHRRRQDLLTPYLGRQAYSGRFSTGKTRFVLPLTDGFHRWTQTQQETFALTLTEVTQDTRRDNYGIFSAINQLAALPDVSPAPLAILAEEDSKNLALRDTALRAMGRLDGGQGVPLLLEALNDDRGRIAIYALRPALMQMPPERALQLLKTAPTDKVTVAKEVIRLLGDLKTEGAYQYLLVLDGQDLHRDARIALLRALWEHLERGETWPLLERAAVSSDVAVAQVRLNTLLRCGQLPVTDHDRLLLPRLLTALDAPAEDLFRAAASAVFATYFGSDAPVIGEALRQLLPNRRALSVAIGTLTTALRTNARLMEPTAQAALEALTADPLTLCLQTKIAVLALPWEELATWLMQQAAARTLHADALETAKQTLQLSALRPDANEIDRLETALADSPDRYIRRLALAALVQSSEKSGWTEERRERLKVYQADAAPLVAEAAQFTFPPETA